jgi:hypothetical protein
VTQEQYVRQLIENGFFSDTRGRLDRGLAMQAMESALRIDARDAGRAQTDTTNDQGQWVPAIPLPLYGLRKQCQCRRKFWTTAGYRGHYALAHILHLGAPPDAG